MSGPGRLLAAAVAVAGCLAVSSAALGDPPTRAGEAAARRHFREGMKHYDLAEYGDAIRELRQAYDISSAPELLFNLAQAARKARLWDTAHNFYQSYLRQLPRARNRADVEKFMAEVEQSMRAELSEAPLPPLPKDEPTERVSSVRVAPLPAPHKALSVPPPAAPEKTEHIGAGQRAPQPAPDLTAKGESPHPGRVAEGVGAALGVAGIGLVAIGGYYAASSVSDGQEIDRLAVARGIWSDRYQTIYNNGHSAAIDATALFIAGGAAVGIGAVVAIVGYHQNSVAQRFAVVPAVGGGSIAFSGTF